MTPSAAPRRVSVVGNSGSGKSTLAAEVAQRLGVDHIELDALFHQPGWQDLPIAEFRAVVTEAAARHAWVIDGNYSAVREVIWERADTVAWLDLPRWRVMGQVVGRTLRRAILRTELWNGNREPWSNLLSWDPERSIIAWSWTNHAKYQQRYLTATTDPRWSQITFVALRSRREVAAWLGSLTITAEVERLANRGP